MEVKCPLQPTGYPECNPSHSDLEKRSKGGTFYQDNTILERIKVRLQDLVRIYFTLTPIILATIGHDIILNELMERTIQDTLDGTYNLILRNDGRLIVEPDKIETIKQKDGYFNILESDDQHLINIFESIKNINQSQFIIDNKTEFLAVSKIEGPDWYFITVYPKALLASQAFKTTHFILILGIILLIAVILLLFLVLRNQVIKPLYKFVTATQEIASGNFNSKTDTYSLLITRSDELGQLANSFQDMTTQLQSNFVQNNTQDWIKTGQAELNKLTGGDQYNSILLKNIITFLCKYVEAQVGLFYLTQVATYKS